MSPTALKFPISLGLALLALAGCGQSGPVATTAPPAATALAEADLAALADFPDIATQIERATVSIDLFGTRVSKLPTPGKAKGATFLTYKAMDNNLSTTLDEHLNTLERAGSSAGINVLALTDGDEKGDTRQYYLRQDRDFKKITSPYVRVGQGGESDTATAAAVKRAVRWADGTYPAKFRWVDINSHGGGYYGICIDDRGSDVIHMPQLAGALAGGGPIDLLTFDACQMATAEVAFELRKVAKVMVASEDDSLALGMNYDKSLMQLASQPASDPAALARDLVLRAQRLGPDSIARERSLRHGRKTKGPDMAIYTISALDLGKAERVASAVDQLAVALLAALPHQRAAIAMSLNAARPFYIATGDHRDLREVIDQLRQRVQDRGVQAGCQAVSATLFNKNGAILLARAANQEGNAPRGLSIYLPTNGSVDPIYRACAFAKATHWDEFLAALKT